MNLQDLTSAHGKYRSIKERRGAHFVIRETMMRES
jgi:hypothetical protein